MRVQSMMLTVVLSLAAGAATAADCPDQLPDHPGSWHPFKPTPYDRQDGIALPAAEVQLMQKKIESLLAPLKAAMPAPQGVSISAHGNIDPVSAKASRIRAELYLLFFEWANNRQCQPELSEEGDALYLHVNHLHEPNLLLAGVKTQFYLETPPTSRTRQGYARWDLDNERGISIAVEPKDRKPWLPVSQQDFLLALIEVLHDTTQKAALAGPNAGNDRVLGSALQKVQASLDGLSPAERTAPARLSARNSRNFLMDWQGFAPFTATDARAIVQFDTGYYKGMKKRTDIRNILIHYERASAASKASYPRFKALLDGIDYDAYAAQLDP